MDNVNSQQSNENKIFKVEEELLVIPYSEIANVNNIYTASNMEDVYAKLPNYINVESTDSPEKQESHVVEEKLHYVEPENYFQSVEKSPLVLPLRSIFGDIFATDSPPQGIVVILRMAKRLFKKTNWTLCHWIHPTASTLQIKQILDDIWETSSHGYKEFFIWQVLPLPDIYNMFNPRIEIAPPRRRKNRRLDLVKILPPPKPIAGVSGVQDFNKKCGEAQSTIVSSILIESKTGIENNENEPPQKKPKLNPEKIEQESKSSLSSQDRELLESVDEFKKIFEHSY
ncbi:unnamed protein product [Ceutorhynchus assimilis]|uniref:Uncharacterized protein n=1 Tax=Ceutorhynchus assimilis TaxID=467358 RepID=A0A9N9MKX1_9CUCU|nr:unnamed protein product [Ceutorhynchus assimilis]